MKVGGLFSGIGGIELGLERAGFEIAWLCDIEPYCQRVLQARWPNIPVYGDIHDLHNPPPVEVLCGGFPCQDISAANPDGQGLGGPKSGLWREFARLVRDVGPTYVLVENVDQLRRRGLGIVLADLAALGYDAEWQVLPASAFGAPHIRERIFVLAYPHRVGQQEQRRAFSTAPEHPAPERCDWWTVEPRVGRVASRFPGRVDRLRCLGNAVVPQVAEYVGQRILRFHEEA